MRSSYSRSWRTLAPSPSATFFGEIISKTIFTKNVVVTGSRCLLLCNKVCFNGAHFQMCCLDSRHLPGPLRSRGSSQPPSRARCPHPGGGTFPERCFPFSFFFSSTAFTILGSRLGSRILFLEEVSKKGHRAPACSAVHEKEVGNAGVRSNSWEHRHGTHWDCLQASHRHQTDGENYVVGDPQ